MFILKSLLIVFIVGILAAAAIIYYAFSSLQNIMRRFRDNAGADPAMGRNNNSDETRSRSTRTDNGDTIIDRRSRQEAEQKIFKREEGEYVDYEEEK